jgi:cell division septal protein FtsQ
MIGAAVRSIPRPRAPALLRWPILKRRLLVAGVLLALLFAGYHFWLRNSSLVAVEAVTIKGAEQGGAAETALREAALEQTTLHVDAAALEAAVADDPTVRSISVTTDFPHGLKIDVDIRQPVGYLKPAGVVVAGDGVILSRESGRPDGLTAIKVRNEQAAKGATVSGGALQVTRVLGAAPAELAAVIGAAATDPDHGVVIGLQGGLELRFGGASDAEAKWAAAAAVLADRRLETAAYLDLTVAERPVAGGVPGVPQEAAPESAAPDAVTAPPPVEEPVAPAPVAPEPAAGAPLEGG